MVFFLLRKQSGEKTMDNELNLKLKALVDGVPHPIANLANASALLWESLENINWAGFYLIENGILVLGPFQGKLACIEIPLTKGVCGAAARENRTFVVENVHEFPGHIACDCASNSEIVVPLHAKDGSVIGVLDIDSPLIGRFTDEDRVMLEEFAAIIESCI
jgi:GAF domain-containing protein